MFDPDTFLQTETSETGDTEYTPIPEGEYTGVIKEIKSGVTSNGSPFLNVLWTIDDQEVKDFTGMPEPTCRQTLWLDVNENGSLEFGPNKNIGLNRLRSALGQNDGKPWSPLMMEGQVARVLVKQSTNAETGVTYANVTQVAAA